MRSLLGEVLMKVMMLTYGFDPCPQSSSQRVSSFAQAMAQSGFEVTVITASCCLGKERRRSGRQLFGVYDLKCPRFMIPLSNLVLNPILILLFSFMAIPLLLRRRVDLILVSVPYGEVAIAGFLLSKMFGSSLVIDMRDLYPSPPELSLAYARLPRRVNEILTSFLLLVYKSSSKIVCVDSYIKEKLEGLGISEEKIFIVPNGADVSIHKPRTPGHREKIRLKYGLPLDQVIFVYAGSLTRYYPVIEAIKGVKTLLTEEVNFQLLIISYSGIAFHRGLTKNLGLEEMVKFVGPLSVSETARVLSACDVGVVVYGSEDYWKGAYGSKIFSYMSCGLPILASGPSGSVISELISEHQIGFFIGAPNAQSFAKGFSFFLDNKNMLDGMRRKAVKVVRKYYDRRVLGLELVALLRV